MNSQSATKSSPGRAVNGSALARNWSGILVALLTVATMFGRFLFPQRFLIFYTDDFFYYVNVARNLTVRGISSADGVHLTNGYHPLWLLVCTVLFKAAPGKMFFYAVALVCFAAVLTIFVLCKRTLAARAGDNLLTDVAAITVAMTAAVLIRTGMEVVASLPLAFLLCAYRMKPGFRWTHGQAFTMGAISGLLVLSRLDAAIAVGLFFVLDAYFERATFGNLVRRGWYFFLGASPVLVYVALNRAVFGVWMPVSGMAKELRLHHFPVIAPYLSVVHPFNLATVLIAIPGIVASVALIVYLPRAKRDLAPYRALLWTLALFPFAYLTALSFISDWQLWFWYLYPFVLSEYAACFVFVPMARELLKKLPSRLPVRIFASGVCAFWIVYTLGWATGKTSSTASQNSLLNLSLDLRAFSLAHPGTIAMGDDAGMAGYFSPYPLVQLEGLVMDGNYLSHIRNDESLIHTLKLYHVRYYVTIAPHKVGDCYEEAEPEQAGRDSHRMRGTICQQPMAVFEHSRLRAAVFDVDQMPGTGLAAGKAF